MLQGTLDMLVLRTLVMGDAHGHTITKVIERTSEDVLEVEQGRSIRRCTGWKIVAGCRRTGERAKTIARRSFTS